MRSGNSSHILDTSPTSPLRQASRKKASSLESIRQSTMVPGKNVGSGVDFYMDISVTKTAGSVLSSFGAIQRNASKKQPNFFFLKLKKNISQNTFLYMKKTMLAIACCCLAFTSLKAQTLVNGMQTNWAAL